MEEHLLYLVLLHNYSIKIANDLEIATICLNTYEICISEKLD